MNLDFLRRLFRRVPAAPKPAPPIRRFDLDPSQLAAVRARSRRTLVEGGPGTGKTEVCARWAVGLIAEGANPAEILILTPNLRAAQAMRQRTLQLLAELPEPKGPPNVGTFLTVAAAQLREAPAVFRLTPGFTIQSEYDSVELWREVLGERGLPDTEWEAKGLRSTVANSARRGGGLEESLSQRFKGRATKYSDACRTYEARKRELNRLDPEDALKIWWTRMLCEASPLERLRERIRSVAIDDFQNCSPLEAHALFRWRPHQLFVLGDDAQAIGSRRGAPPGRLRDYTSLAHEETEDNEPRNEEPEVHTLTLAFNHRSGQHLLDFANDVHRLVRSPAAPRLRAAPETPPLNPDTRQTFFNKWTDPDMEAKAAFRWFRDLRARGEAAENLCVLARSPFDLEKLKVILYQNDVPYETLDLAHFPNPADPASVVLPPASLAGLTLGSIHSAAGREWNHVLLLGVGERQLPDPKGNPEEERRLFYVAVTRAKQSLTGSYPSQLTRKGPQGPCKFLPLDRIEWNP